VALGVIVPEPTEEEVMVKVLIANVALMVWFAVTFVNE
jgi:hypothetical protein